MIINKISIQNFKQYYGKQKDIILSNSKDKSVTIINGKNGAGKTNFFTAINWCLYGEKIVNIDGEIINKNSLKEAKVGDEITARVSINFSHEGSKFLIVREISKTKTEKNKYEDLGSSEIYMTQVDLSNDIQLNIENPLSKLNTILPSNVRQYFLFDGERIDEFAKPEHSAEVWEAIKNVLKLEVIERGKKHLYDISKEFSKKLKSYDDVKLNELLIKEEELQLEKEECNNNIDRTNQKLKECTRQIEIIEERQNEIEEIRDLTRKREKIREKQSLLTTELEELNNELKKTISSSNLIFADRVFYSVRKDLDRIVKDREIASETIKKVCQKILKDGTCLCGTDIDRGSHEHQVLMEKLNLEDLESDNESFLIDLKAQLEGVIEKRKGLIEKIKIDFSKTRKLKNDVETLEKKESDISLQLKDDKYEDIAKLEKKRSQLLEDKGKNLKALDDYKEELEKIDFDYQTIQDQIEKEKSYNNEMNKVKNKKILSEKSSLALEKIYNEFAEEMRLKIEEKSSNIFHKLIRKKESFEKIKLDKNYQLKLIDRFGDIDARSEISAGERQVLSLSFILGLSKVSEGEAPLVMDTPFGRLDSDHRRNIIANIPELTSQLVLFVTDEELDDDNRSIIQSKVEYEYNLNFDDFTGNTYIEEVF